MLRIRYRVRVAYPKSWDGVYQNRIISIINLSSSLLWCARCKFHLRGHLSVSRRTGCSGRETEDESKLRRAMRAGRRAGGRRAGVCTESLEINATLICLIKPTRRSVLYSIVLYSIVTVFHTVQYFIRYYSILRIVASRTVNQRNWFDARDLRATIYSTCIYTSFHTSFTSSISIITVH